MELFIDWLIGNMGTQGEYSYTPMHYITTGIVVAAVVLLGLVAWLCRNNPKSARAWLVGVCSFQLTFEVGWRLIYWLIKGDSPLCWWPMYPCNLNGLLIPIAALCKSQRMKKLFYLFGFVGGVLTFALPDGIFSTDVFVFPILKSVLQHTGLLIIPVMELVGGSYRPSLRHMGWVTAGCLIHIFNCEVLDRLLGFTGDYMFLRGDLPFVIPGVPQWITMLVFGFVVLCILSFLCDIQDSCRFLRFGKRRESIAN